MLGSRDKTVNEVNITPFSYEGVSIVKKKNMNKV